MNVMTYCGYVEISKVVIYRIMIIIFWIICMCFILWRLNLSLVIISLKLGNLFFVFDWEIILRYWSLLFLIIVLLISLSVIVFSLSYINSVNVSNFIFLYLSFVIRIVWLILNNNFYWIIFGWDGLGVVSFLLIIYYLNYESSTNGLFTLFQNRIGDLFFVLFILGRLNILIRNRILIYWGLIFLIFGACVKRAQFPFNAWLLSAISAPTPISSLVHSSTLVVAGIYILLEYSYCLIEVLDILKFIRVLTLLYRRFGLLNEWDIKKLIAYSTISHVSLILYLLRFKLFKIVYFHLNIHAIFKSLIFMCFGYVILVSFHRQDKRFVRLVLLNPLVKLIYYISCLCIIGLPILRAFFSKDLIIEKFIEFRREILYVYLLILFLGIRIYYAIKLLNLTSYMFSYRVVEKHSMRLLSVVSICIIIILIINIYLSFVFSIRIEFFSSKMFIYLFILFFFFLRIFTNLNYKNVLYDKSKNFLEVWSTNWLLLDQVIYFFIGNIVSLVRKISSIKLVLVLNWWVIVMFIFLFYSKSFKSVTLKKLRN